MNTDEIKDKIVEEILLNDESPVDYNIQAALDILNQTDLSNDDWYIFEGWEKIHEIEHLTGLDIDTILNQWTFSDSAVICAHCFEIIHTDGYYKPDYWLDIDNGQYICGDCIRDNEDFANEYIEYLSNNDKSANTILKLEDYGFTVCNCNENECQFENGFHRGQNDDPVEILKNAISKNRDVDYVFEISDMNPFEIKYTLYHRE